MTWRPTWPELLSLFEELRFQLGVVAVVVTVGAVAVAVTLPRPGAFSSNTEPAPRSTTAGVAAGAEPTTAISAESPVMASTIPDVPVQATAGATPGPRSVVRAATFAVGDRTQLAAPAPIRLTCSEDQPPIGVLLSGRAVEVIEVGASTCEHWILVQSGDGLTWLRAAVLEPVTTAVEAGPTP